MRLRFGLIGCGDMGRLRAAALHQSGATELVGVSDVDQGRAGAVASQYGGTVAKDWRALLDRRDVDAVAVSTPPSLHAEMCLQALESGKHVLCEKPLARTPEECRRIVEAAEGCGRFVATGFNYRFFPSFQKARALLDSGLIGSLDHLRSYAGYSATDHGQAWVHDANVVGGGTLWDNGIHLIDITRYFLGEVAEVKGFATNGVWGFERSEDNGFALLRSSEGKIAALQASWTEWRGYRFGLEIFGSRGCIKASIFPMMLQATWAGETGGPTRRLNDLFPRTNLMEHLRSYRWVALQSLVQELRAFARAVGGERTAIATGYDGLRAVEVAHQAASASGWQSLAVPAVSLDSVA